MLEITINGKKLQARKNSTVLEAALENGIHIPHLCYHPKLSISACCRLCLVKVNPFPKLMPACNTVCTENMEIDTECAEVKEVQKAAMQFLTMNHPVDCGICDKSGECKLQNYNFAYNSEHSISKEPKDHKPKYEDIHDRIFYDAERCVLCSRCVRFTWEISKTKALGIVGQGGKAKIARVKNELHVDHYIDNIVDICPVGGMLAKDFLYQSRVWYLEEVPSVCPGCERGCLVNLWRKKKKWHYQSCLQETSGRVFRVTPRNNGMENGPWICNTGRDFYKFFQDERLNGALLKGKNESLEKVISDAKKLISKATNRIAVLSLYGSNEELQACQEALASKWKFIFKDERNPEKDEPIEDDFLIRKNKNPNIQTAKQLFTETNVTDIATADLLLVWGRGFDFNQVKANTKVIYLTAFKDEWTAKADITIAISTMMERSGSFTNFENKTQGFERVFDKSDTVYHARDIFKLLKGIA